MKALTTILLALLVLGGCSQVQEVEVKEVTIFDLVKEMQFIYLKCENDSGYSYEDVTQSPDKLILKYKSLYAKKFDDVADRCIRGQQNIEDCSGLSTKKRIKSRSCSLPDSDHENDRYCSEIFDLNFNFLNISNDIPDVKPDKYNDKYKENKIVFSLANKQFFKAWGYRTPNQIPIKAYSSLNEIKSYSSGQMWILNRETLKLFVYTPRATIENYSCEISDKDHYEKAGQALDYLVNEINKVTYYGEGKKEFTDRYNEKLKSYKASILKEKNKQLKKNKI